MRILKILTIFLLFVLTTSLEASEKRICIELITVITEDKRLLSGALFGEPDPEKPWLIFIHGYGGDFYSGINAFLPGEMAKRGVVSLSVNTRDHGKGPKTSIFEDCIKDIDAMIHFALEKGAKDIFLVGESMGTNKVMLFASRKTYPEIKGLILIASPGNLFEWNVRVFGREKVLSDLNHAKELIKQKKEELIVVDLGPLGKNLYSPQHLVSLRDPDSQSDPFKNIEKISLPMLFIHGSKDRLVDPEVSRMLSSKRTKFSELSIIEGADHEFRGYEDELCQHIERWIKKLLTVRKVSLLHQLYFPISRD